MLIPRKLVNGWCNPLINSVYWAYKLKPFKPALPTGYGGHPSALTSIYSTNFLFVFFKVNVGR